MTRLVLQMGISIDGFVALPDGSQPWLGEREDDAAKPWKLETVRGTDAHLMGRVTYQEMAAHWPGSDSEYAAPMNDIPKVVFSNTLQTADWPESRIAGGDLVDEYRLNIQPAALGAGMPIFSEMPEPVGLELSRHGPSAPAAQATSTCRGPCSSPSPCSRLRHGEASSDRRFGRGAAARLPTAEIQIRRISGRLGSRALGSDS
jgi:dihydrofolate reductase